MQLIRTLGYELYRLWPLLAIIAAALILLGDVAQLAVQLYTLSMVAMVVAVVHLIRKALFPYVDLSTLVSRAKDSPAGAAIVYAATVALISVIILASTGHAAGIPERARPLLPVLVEAQAMHWPDMPLQHIPAGQVEQESSWREDAELRTSREHGRGLVQLTVAYRADGSERFNSYREAVRTFPALAGWDWREDPYSVRHQLAYLVLQDRANFGRVTRLGIDDPEQAWRAGLVCYNAGPGRVLKRRAYALAEGLPADRWTGGLEDAHGPAEDRVLYGRPLWQLVNEYPLKILRRAEKYRHVVCHTRGLR